MGKKFKPRQEGINFWQSTTDMMTAIVLILLLIILLLLFYLMQIPEYSLIDNWVGDNQAEYEEEGEGDEEDDDFHGVDEEGDAEEEEDDFHEKYPIVTSGGGGGGGGEGSGTGTGNRGKKSAVFVLLVDGETDRLIPEKDVVFELYSYPQDVLQQLNTYYPEKITYTSFATTEEGTFYLPEKIPETRYTIREITPVKGYEMGGRYEFYIDKTYDWPEPFMVRYPVFPARNVIRVQMLDQKTEIGLPFGTYDILAAEDIVTEDGTCRYHKDDIVDTIVCDENGLAESKELYLGWYLIRALEVPEYYATKDIHLTVLLEKPDGTTRVPVQDPYEKTTLSLSLSDELTHAPLAGVGFTLTGGTLPNRLLETDKMGKIEISDLEKNTEYSLRQTSVPDNYLAENTLHSFAVSVDGRIDGVASADMELTNRTLRISVLMTDKLFKKALTGISFSLSDSNGNIVKTWNSTGGDDTITGLPEGEYTVVINNNTAQSYSITIQNTAEIQRYHFSKWTTQNIVILAVGGLVLFGLLFLLIFLILFFRRRKKQSQS